MSIIHCKTKLTKIGSWTVFRLPKEASAKLPSRGMTMVKGTINDHPFQVALEPDGKGSHWFKVDETMQKDVRIAVGDAITVEIEPIKEWPEPTVPTDLKKALGAAPQANILWKEITPMARWDWIRWIRATKQAETRRRRIEVAISKLTAGNRRPCCFNRTECTVPDVSNNGVLLDSG